MSVGKVTLATVILAKISMNVKLEIRRQRNRWKICFDLAMSVIGTPTVLIIWEAIHVNVLMDSLVMVSFATISMNVIFTCMTAIGPMPIATIWRVHLSAFVMKDM